MYAILHRLPLGWAGRFALLRLASQWRSLLTVALSVLLAAVIGASAPLYTTAIAQVGMIQRLSAQPLADVHLSSRLSLKAAGTDDLDAAWTSLNAGAAATIHELFDAELPGWVSDVIVMGETSPMQASKDGEDLGIRLRVAYYEGWQGAAELVEGAWPGEPAGAGIDVEAALGVQAAHVLGLGVGDAITLEQRGWASSIPARARITAVIREGDADDPYWMSPSPLRVGSSDDQIETNLLTTRAGFLRVAADHIPETRSTLGWRLCFDHLQLPFSQVAEAVARLDDVEALLPKRLGAVLGTTDLRVLFSTQLGDILRAYTDEVELLGAPFGLVLLQIGALALFFLVTTAALVRRGERREVAMLQSRGALDRQILWLRGVEALVICAAAAVAAPFVARQLLVWLMPPIVGVERLPLPLNLTVFVSAGAVAVAALAALMMTLRPVLRLPLILAGGGVSRGERQVWWQRYYLDLVLLAVGVVALGRMIETRSALTTTQRGELKADPLLLLAPAFLFVALGSVLLRLFPALMAVVARVFAARRGLAGALATWQVSREPAHYGRITFLLTLAIGIGWFATSFQATAALSQRDQAHYLVGADLRLEEYDPALEVDRARAVDAYTAMPGVQAATTALRLFLPNASKDLRRSMRGEILAVDPDIFGAVAYWRDDLGPLKLPRRPGEPPAAPLPGRGLPFTPVQVGVWARFDQGETGDGGYPLQPNPEAWASHLDLRARLQDESGAFFLLPLKPVLEAVPDHPLAGAEGWVYCAADLAASTTAPRGALRLDSLYWAYDLQSNFNYWAIMRLALTGLTLVDSDGRTTALDWLSDRDAAWDLITLAETDVQAFDLAPSPGAESLSSRQVEWEQGRVGIIGLFLDYPEAGPIPAVASETLMAVNGLLPGALYQMGDIGRVTPQFEIRDTARYFPTLYGDERLFLIVDRAALLYALNRSPGAAWHANEAWLRLAPGADAEALVADLRAQGGDTVVTDAMTFAGALEGAQTNLLSAGLMGLLYLAFGIALALSVVSLLTYVALTVKARRGEFGVLRAFGLSSARLLLSIALEQGLVMVTAAALGVMLGAALSYQILPALAVSATGGAVTPPFLVQVEAAALAQYGLVLLAVLAVTLATSVLLVRRLSLAQVLRLAEE